MPPSPIITASVNPAPYLRLMAELELDDPPRVIFKPARDTKNGYWASYTHGLNRVTVYMAQTYYDTNDLRHVASALSRLLLHECRHAWQYRVHGADWVQEDSKTSMPYNSRREEVDCLEFEDRRLHDYRGLVRVSRKFPSSPFSRLAKTQANVLRNV